MVLFGLGELPRVDDRLSYQQCVSSFQGNPFVKNSAVKRAWWEVNLKMNNLLENFLICARARPKCAEKTYVGLWGQSTAFMVVTVTDGAEVLHLGIGYSCLYIWKILHISCFLSAVDAD